MNERIRELIDECTEWITGTIDGDVECFDKEKFAQLIAQECARLAMTQHSSTSPDDYHDMEPYNQGCDNTASTISGLIRLTFGVDNVQVVRYTTETAQAQQQQKDTE